VLGAFVLGFVLLAWNKITTACQKSGAAIMRCVYCKWVYRRNSETRGKLGCPRCGCMITEKNHTLDKAILPQNNKFLRLVMLKRTPKKRAEKQATL
jgi:hypothetical protein